MINWRKPLILAGLTLSGSKIPRYLKEIERVSQLPRDEIVTYQKGELEKLLLHASEHVPYYHRVLPEAGVISNGKVHLENFSEIPVLTKDIIRKEGANLYSDDRVRRRYYHNTSGGSTGEPVAFIQDKEYNEWNIATKLFYNKMLGKELGDCEYKIWGSERDIFSGTIGFQNKLINLVYNRHFFNSYLITDAKLRELVVRWNEIKPRYVWSYVDSAFELAKFVAKTGCHLCPPERIIVTTGVLTEDTRTFIEKELDTKVYNQYGSREVGPIACECPKQSGLHAFDFFQFIELTNLDPMGHGNVTITNLRNYSMPLIRYEIEDTAKISGQLCPCGMQLSLIDSISGRTFNHFLLEDGTRVHGQYFVALFFFKDWVKKFQIIQQSYDKILCRVVTKDCINESDIEDIKSKIRLVMGSNCEIEFDFVDEILPAKSGKYIYTICEVGP